MTDPDCGCTPPCACCVKAETVARLRSLLVEARDALREEVGGEDACGMCRDMIGLAPDGRCRTHYTMARLDSEVGPGEGR